MAAPIYNPIIPCVHGIPGGLFPGRMLRFQGTVPPNADRFAINLQCGPNTDPRDDIALHLNFRFAEMCVVRNNLVNMNWGPEDTSGGMPLVRGQPFEALILCEAGSIKVALNGVHFCEFAHRTQPQRITHITVDGDVQLQFIGFEGPQYMGAADGGFQAPGYGAPPPSYAQPGYGAPPQGFVPSPQTNVQMPPPPQYGQPMPPPLQSGQQMPPPQYGPQMPTPHYGAQMPPPQYGQQMPSPQYGQQMPPPQYGQQRPPPQYGQQMPPPQYGQQMQQGQGRFGFLRNLPQGLVSNALGSFGGNLLGRVLAGRGTTQRQDTTDGYGYGSRPPAASPGIPPSPGVTAVTPAPATPDTSVPQSAAPIPPSGDSRQDSVPSPSTTDYSTPSSASISSGGD